MHVLSMKKLISHSIQDVLSAVSQLSNAILKSDYGSLVEAINLSRDLLFLLASDMRVSSLDDKALASEVYAFMRIHC